MKKSSIIDGEKIAIKRVLRRFHIIISLIKIIKNLSERKNSCKKSTVLFIYSILTS